MFQPTAVGVIYLRNIKRGIGPEVSNGDPKALLDLLGSRGAVVLDVTGLGFHIVGVKISNCGNIGVGDEAVVALVVVVGQNLPVELSILIPRVVKDVIFEVIIVESGLLIDTIKVVLPGNLGGLASIQVDPDKTVPVNVDMDRECVTLMKSIDASLVVLGDDEIVAGDIIFNKVTGIGDSMLMRGEEPFPGKDRSSFKLKHLLGGIPGSGQSTDRLFPVILRKILLRCCGGTKEVPQERHYE